VARSLANKVATEEEINDRATPRLGKNLKQQWAAQTKSGLQLIPTASQVGNSKR